MKTLTIVAVACALVLLLGCDPEAHQEQGFRLPAGDAKAGRTAFTELGCTTCHTVDGVKLPDPVTRGPVEVKLGGAVHRVRSYGDLVTAIIHPAHDITKPFVAEPPMEPVQSDVDKVNEKTTLMPDYNHTITVQQLVDLTTFLHGRYSELPPADYTYYF